MKQNKRIKPGRGSRAFMLRMEARRYFQTLGLHLVSRQNPTNYSAAAEKWMSYTGLYVRLLLFSIPELIVVPDNGDTPLLIIRGESSIRDFMKECSTREDLDTRIQSELAIRAALATKKMAHKEQS